MANYTWSKNLTTASNDYRALQCTYDLLAEYGPADIDRRHVFTGSYVYYLPFYKDQKGIAGHVLGGWELSGIGYLSALTRTYCLSDAHRQSNESSNSCRTSADSRPFGTPPATFLGTLHLKCEFYPAETCMRRGTTHACYAIHAHKASE